MTKLEASEGTRKACVTIGGCKGPEVEACGAIERIGGGGGAGAPVRPVGGTSHPVP